MCEFRLGFHWSLFLRVQLTIFHHWFRQWLGAGQATNHCLNQWWLVYWRIYASYWRIYASFGLNELMQDCSNFSALLMELLKSCTKPSTMCSCYRSCWWCWYAVSVWDPRGCPRVTWSPSLPSSTQPRCPPSPSGTPPAEVRYLGNGGNIMKRTREAFQSKEPFLSISVASGRFERNFKNVIFSS